MSGEESVQKSWVEIMKAVDRSKRAKMIWDSILETVFRFNSEGYGMTKEELIHYMCLQITYFSGFGISPWGMREYIKSLFLGDALAVNEDNLVVITVEGCRLINKDYNRISSVKRLEKSMLNNVRKVNIQLDKLKKEHSKD